MEISGKDFFIDIISLYNDQIDDNNKYYCSENQNFAQWWAVDLKKIASINSYQIRSGSYSSQWLSCWTLSVSIDNSSWIIADSPPNQEPGDTIFNLSKPFNARYIKLDGSAALYTNGNKALLAFYHIKFFGSLSPLIKHANTCLTNKGINLNLIRMISLICS